jgi:GNAT superfamily N-acetyltransferase
MNLKELHSFKLSDAVTFHDKLNPKLWIGVVLRPDVREQLMTIAQDFLEELGVHDLDVKDITISGSNAAYSYTKHSDLDLHILVDMGNLPVDEVYKELFTAKKTIYNDTHDIKIHGIPVELYVQDSRQPVVSLGEYSVLNDQWLKIPSKRRSNFDQTATKSKYGKLLSLIEMALKSRKYNKVKHIIDTIKRYRQAGLDKGGEFGPENLAYKMLRSQGYITKLYDLRDKLHSEKLSFETMYQNIDEELEHIPTVLYHATYKQRLKNIKLTGLGAGKKRNWPDSRPGVVYLALDPHVAESYAETALDDLDADWDIVILQVSTKGLDSNKFHLDSNVQDNEGDTVEYHGIIPPSNISLYKQGVNENEKEQFNNELWKPGLDFKQDINGILYHVTNAGKKNDFLSIKAYDKRNPNPIGDAQFAKARNLYTGEVQGVTSMKTKVDPKYQGQGIAANMYALIRMLGVNILPSETQTNAGQKMWSKWRKQGDVNSLKDLDPKVKGVAEEHLAEIERMPGNEYTGGKKSLRIGYGDKNIKKLPGTNAFMYSTENNPIQDGVIIKLWDSANIAPKPVKIPDEYEGDFASRLKDWERNQSEDGPGVLIGKLTLENANRFPLKGALQVDTITVDEDYRGQGVAKSMYGVALSILQRPLLAGSSQTPGGRRNWLSLASIPGVDIKGYVMINEARFDNPEWAEKDIDTIMGQLGGQYIGPSKPPGNHYFAFDVVPGSGELAPAVKTELSKIYDEHGSRTGLYAIWSGAVNEQDVKEEYNTMQYASEKTPAINPYGGRKDNQFRGAMSEASGYIPSEKQKNDPRFKTALTVDVHPDTIKKNAKAFYWNTSRAGIPPTAKANGKIS